MSGAVLVLGATSAIARGCCEALAARGYDLYLAGRNREELARLSADLSLRHGVTVQCGRFDAAVLGRQGAFLDEAIAAMGGLHGVVLAVGAMAEPEALGDPQAVARTITVNFTAAAALLTHCASYLERQGSGFIIGISSVAGDRGRQSNYVYGAAKGGLSLFLQGLRNRLYPKGVRVMTVKPGFVDTAMTYGMPGLFLVADPRDVGRRIVRALDRRRDVIYVPGFWRYILWVIRAIPEPVFKRLKL